VGLVQVEVLEVLNRLKKEGLDPNVLAAGTGAALCDLLTCCHGNHFVPEWFQRQANYTRKLVANAQH
jgi:hypothetical protein